MSAINRSVSGALAGLLGFVGMSAIAGVLVTAAVTPALALSGMTATNTINVFENLPDYLSIDQLSQKSNIYAMHTDGTPQLLASFYDQNRVEVPWDGISQFVKDAAVAGEDPRFYEHGGIDLEGTIKGVVSTVATGSARGGSSITQQYVKNVLVQKCEVLADQKKRTACYDLATETSPDRKLKEMRLAIGVEKKYPKDDILRQYLNINGFGGSVYGIESAANYYYNTSAAALTLPQAASLVAIVNNPVKFQLDDPASETNGAANGYAANKERRDYILGEMLKYKKITQADYDAALATPIEPTITEPSTGCQTAGGSAFFCDLVVHTLQTDSTFGADEAARLANFRRGGYNIYTTLDLDLQDAAEATLTENVPKTDPNWDVGGVITSVQVGTGRVLAMTQNKDYSQDPAVQATGANFTGINYNTDIDQGGSSGFQPGSTYKVFTLGEWLTEGHSLNERVDSRRKSDWGVFKDSCNGNASYAFNPKNDANESGANYSALQSTIGSINTGFIGMAKKLDLCGIRKTAEAFGVHRANLEPLEQGPSAVLGTNEVAPLSMAVAFAGIANNGVKCSPIVIDKIIGPDGTEMAPPKSECTQAVTPEVDAGMTYAMQKVMTEGTATASNSATKPRVPMIGKTGTTDGNKDTWMSGSSSKVATVVGVVSVTGDINQRQVYWDQGTAATARHRMWPAVMSVANAKYGGEPFAEASGKVLQAVPIPIPDLRGKSMADATSVLQAAGFEVVDGGATDSELPAGTVARTDPSGTASRGATITVFSSNGNLGAVPDVVGKTEAEATAALQGFAVDKKEQDVTDPKQVGIVLSMTPAGGTGAAAGSAVTIVVGKLANGNGKGNG
ncbi:PASTA domain-containing protein [Cryobacterium sp. TMT1-21]|uniref:PASTA domain-containing protein n=1 Tax=Cryobacterium shii TaxID=1259235 RepID=A0AAQ2C4Y2_9MICO|nr:MULTISPECIES: transglycosylase domain-containing protein [Cryobacterium]TFC43878.1 PASTA domain-containing protein [Cryobacterium shii]TFD16153.1 PASTA domain-containing protein [Cryobacterium sp. TMT1-21]TFD17947.1 PASTA domain-containing protein [Cryobacterium sp. TMT2-23]TFD35898.1 PASTA domain-containing protein [Cryobacterium sp. TMT2-10]